MRVHEVELVGGEREGRGSPGRPTGTPRRLRRETGTAGPTATVPSSGCPSRSSRRSARRPCGQVLGAVRGREHDDLVAPGAQRLGARSTCSLTGCGRDQANGVTMQTRRAMRVDSREAARLRFQDGPKRGTVPELGMRRRRAGRAASTGGNVVHAPSRYPSKRGRATALILATATAALIGAVGTSASVGPQAGHGVFEDFDTRTKTVAPTAKQKEAVRLMGASVRWNRLGTPKSLIRHSGWLAEGVPGATAEAAARNWLNMNRALFKLADVSSLELDHHTRLGRGHAVLLGQRFGGLAPAQDGTVTVGVVRSGSGWKVAYASSGLTGDSGLSRDVQLSAAQAWVAAAQNVGRDVSVANVQDVTADGEWRLLTVSGFAEQQRARLRALPTPKGGVVPVWETYLVQPGADMQAYKHLIDANDGRALTRQDIVYQAAAAEPETFQGDLGTADGACGPLHEFDVPENTFSVDAVATADLPANDIVLLLKREGVTVASMDTATSPEAIHYEPAGGVTPGTYAVQVCEFVDGHGAVPPTTYTGAVTTNSVTQTNPAPYPPMWKVFPANPLPATLETDPWNVPDNDIRDVWCWDSVVQGQPIEGCEYEVQNPASRVPWDYNPRTNSPTYTTLGNNASASESWFLFRAPGPTFYRPFSAARNYSFSWVDDWNNRDCAPDNFVPGEGYDIKAATTNLFVMHNRMHDWSYNLGFTEENWNMQLSNFGNGGAEDDPVLGAAQAGAANGGFPVYNGRDNANMTPLPEGVSPITNMYLWQPIAGLFYPPCADGDYDMAIIGHEYGHAIENRLIGKGGTRAGHHAGRWESRTAT